MEQKKRVYMERIWELAKQGKSAGEIMKVLDISDMATLKNDLQSMMQEKGETINVPGLIGEPGMEEEYTDTGARIPPGMKHPKK